MLQKCAVAFLALGVCNVQLLKLLAIFCKGEFCGALLGDIAVGHKNATNLRVMEVARDAAFNPAPLAIATAQPVYNQRWATRICDRGSRHLFSCGKVIGMNKWVRHLTTKYIALIAKNLSDCGTCVAHLQLRAKQRNTIFGVLGKQR